jgi:hypothetical protein
VLCGAGISGDAPTKLQSGPEIRDFFAVHITGTLRAIGLSQASGSRGAVNQLLDRVMPERIIEPFHRVFGDDVFTFMDHFFAINPNLNHKSLVRLANGTTPPGHHYAEP